ncbi:hypothetical protein MJH12_12005, partial [bacterium]|nr:hypothetical protein [bacterium]
MQIALYSSIDETQASYSQTFTNVAVSDGIFLLELGPCLPDLFKTNFVQLSVNNQSLTPRTKLLSSALSINSKNSEKLSGLTSQALFLKVDESINLILADFSTNTITPALQNTDASLTSHLLNQNNPHGLTKGQVGLSLVDNIQQIPLSYVETSLSVNSDLNIPSSKAVSNYVSLELSNFSTGFEAVNPNLQTHLLRVDNPHQVSKSQLMLEQVTNVLQLPMSYFQTILSTTSNLNVPSSSAVATFVEKTVFYKQAIFADQFNSNQVSNLMSSALADGTKPWQTLNNTSVGLNNVPNTNIAYSVTIPADQFTTAEVSNLKAGKLSDNSAPWTGKESAIVLGSTTQYFRGDKTWQVLDKQVIGLGNVPNTSIAYSTAISADDFSQSQVNQLRLNKLSDGSSPWSVPSTT